MTQVQLLLNNRKVLAADKIQLYNDKSESIVVKNNRSKRLAAL